MTSSLGSKSHQLNASPQILRNTSLKQILTLPNGANLAYIQNPGRLPGIVFLGGFMADMNGTKASYLDRFCQEQNRAFLRFDYFGHGASEGDVINGSIGRWKQDVIDVLDQLTEGPQILVGSSMGGWLMFLAALARPLKIKALVGIAPAPDFLKPLVWDRLTLAQQAEVMQQGVCYVPSPFQDRPYPISKLLIEEGKQHEILNGSTPIPIHCPVRLLHGVKDIEVPYTLSLKLMENLASEDIRVTLIKDGDHRLNSEAQLKVLSDAILEVT